MIFDNYKTIYIAFLITLKGANTIMTVKRIALQLAKKHTPKAIMKRISGQRALENQPSYGYLENLMSNYQVKDLVNVDPKSFKNRIDEFLQLRDYEMEGFKSPDKQRGLAVRFHWGHNHDFGDFSLAGRMENRHLTHLAIFIDKFGAIPRSLEGLRVKNLSLYE